MYYIYIYYIYPLSGLHATPSDGCASDHCRDGQASNQKVSLETRQQSGVQPSKRLASLDNHVCQIEGTTCTPRATLEKIRALIYSKGSKGSPKLGPIMPQKTQLLPGRASNI